MKKLTIVTVCYQDLESLKKTLESLRQQTTRDFEHWIVDGASKDGTPAYLADLKVPWDLHWMSEPDRGLYEAMNKGLERASGEFIWFLNAGDRCANTSSVENILKALTSNPGADLIYGLVGFESDFGIRMVGKKVSRINFMSGMPICHQGIVYRTEVLRRHPYETKYRIISDWLATRRFFESEASCVFAPFEFATYNLEGVSSKNHRLAIKEQLRAEKSVLGKLSILAVKGTRYFGVYFTKKIGLYDFYKRWEHR